MDIVFVGFKKGVFMGSLGLLGIGQAGLTIGTNSDKAGKAEKFSDEFSINGKQVRTFGDFFAWKMKKVLENMQELLKKLRELYKLAGEMNENGTYNGQALAANASDELKALSREHGLDLSTASAADILSLIKRLEEEILQFGKQYAIGSVKKNTGTIAHFE